MALFVCYPKCTTCRKAEKWLEENGIAFEERNIKEQNPTVEELREWHRKSGLELKKFFNTSGLLYKSKGLSQKLSSMSEEEQFTLLSTDGMLVKRPIFVDGDTVLVGFKEEQWEKLK
ncbi:arsenate reductase family protein [Caproiciproducens faecalis]|uniref:Arsenate reductase family protein n=1 Tax=Caproiciproducens faecalis TaxID=2820301 RepID=A0ABS7DLS1_9FIRM|nr:arsenate reductase family protein [Caproiciproducens faecalis]MBW7572254.1 arsenate reductase family protein [Caproiciproducens faecalis]